MTDADDFHHFLNFQCYTPPNTHQSRWNVWRVAFCHEFVDSSRAEMRRQPQHSVNDISTNQSAVADDLSWRRNVQRNQKHTNSLGIHLDSQWSESTLITFLQFPNEHPTSLRPNARTANWTHTNTHNYRKVFIKLLTIKHFEWIKFACALCAYVFGIPNARKQKAKAIPLTLTKHDDRRPSLDRIEKMGFWGRERAYFHTQKPQSILLHPKEINIELYMVLDMYAHVRKST